MKSFNIKKGILLKNNKNNLDIINANLISLIPFIILNIINNSILPVYNNIGTLYQVFKPIIIFFTLMISVLFISKDDLENKNYLLLQSIIYGLIINININILLIISIGILINILSVKESKINKVPIGYMLLEIISNNNINNTPLILGIISILLVAISIIYLSKFAFYKWRIILFYIITIVLGIILLYIKNKDNYIIIQNIIINLYLFKVLYLTIDMPSTPITHKGQITEGIILGMSSLIGLYYNILIKDIVLIILIFNIIIVLLNRIKIKI